MRQIDSLLLRQKADTLMALAPALELAGSTHTLRDLLGALEQGQCQLWMHEDSVAVTEILVMPRARVCHVWLAGGERGALEDHILPDIEDWARTMNCDRVTIAGRRGWERTLAGKGYGHRLTYLTKELDQ